MPNNLGKKRYLLLEERRGKKRRRKKKVRKPKGGCVKRKKRDGEGKTDTRARKKGGLIPSKWINDGA